MSAASEALADVRGWLCDNLGEGEAGKVCGMLSVVSRRIVELEDENIELQQERDLFRELFDLTTQPDLYVQVRDENAKLRKLVLSLYESALICCGECWLSVPHSPAMCGNDNCGHRQNYLAMQELGIEFKGDGWMSRALYEMTERMDDLGEPHD